MDLEFEKVSLKKFEELQNDKVLWFKSKKVRDLKQFILDEELTDYSLFETESDNDVLYLLTTKPR